MPDHIDLVLPDGTTLHQPICYETVAKFCSCCKKLGHNEETCENKIPMAFYPKKPETVEDEKTDAEQPKKKRSRRKKKKISETDGETDKADKEKSETAKHSAAKDISPTSTNR
ncbi:UNVERIFIED_CONTAM: hypothetical protein ITH36_24900, partial [Salmonella enterica subsp. enterica serovar Weltevreden]